MSLSLDPFVEYDIEPLPNPCQTLHCAGGAGPSGVLRTGSSDQSPSTAGGGSSAAAGSSGPGERPDPDADLRCCTEHDHGVDLSVLEAEADTRNRAQRLCPVAARGEEKDLGVRLLFSPASLQPACSSQRRPLYNDNPFPVRCASWLVTPVSKIWTQWELQPRFGRPQGGARTRGTASSRRGGRRRRWPPPCDR